MVGMEYCTSSLPIRSVPKNADRSLDIRQLSVFAKIVKASILSKDNEYLLSSMIIQTFAPEYYICF